MDQAPAQGDVARDLGNLAPTGFPLVLLQILQLWQGCRQELQDDRGVDERQDSKREHAEGRDAPAGEDVEETQQGAALLDEAGKGLAVDPWDGDVDAETHQKQQAQGGEHSIAQARVADQLADDFGGVGIAAPTDEHGQEEWGGLNAEKPPVD